MQNKPSTWLTALSLMMMIGLPVRGLASETATISGTLHCPEDFVIPPNTIGYLTLSDVSPRQDIFVTTIARQIVHEPCRGAMAFELAYDPTKIHEHHNYAIYAQIAAAGRVILANDSAHLVITQGNPSVVEIYVEPLVYPPNGLTD